MRLHHYLGRAVGPFLLLFFTIYNHLFRVPRARVLVWNEKEELLLVRNWGGKRQWSLPGGGVKRKERPLEAAKRELYEEVGLNVPLQKFDYVSTFFYQYEAPIFVVTVAKDDLPIKPHNPREITDQRWFPSKELPSDLSPLVSIALKYLSKND